MELEIYMLNSQNNQNGTNILFCIYIFFVSGVFGMRKSIYKQKQDKFNFETIPNRVE